MSKLSNRDIEKLILQWVREKPVVEIARHFQITRQRVYQLISQLKEMGEYPALKRSGRKPQPIDEQTEDLIFESYRANNVGPYAFGEEDRSSVRDSCSAKPNLSGIIAPRPSGNQHEETATAEVCPV